MNRTLRPIRFFLLALLLGLAPTTLRAGTPPPDTQAEAHRTQAKDLEAKYDYAAAIAEYQQAYDLDKTTHLEDATLDLYKIGSAYDDLSQHPKALAFYRQALPLRRQIGDRAGEANTLSNIGEADTLSDIGGVYDALSQYDKALDYYQQALTLERQVGDRAGEANTLSNIGGVYDALSQYDKALDFFGQALTLRRQVGDKEGEAGTLSSIGTVYDALSQYAKALDYLQQALTIERQVGDRADEATTLNNLADEATTLNNLMLTWKSLKQPGVAVLYGKQSVNAYQGIRRSLAALDKEIEKSYLAANAKTYRTLADLLIGQGRLPEAEQVLGLLKRQETFDLLRGDTSGAGPAGQADLTPEEAAQETIYEGIAGQITALGQEQQALLDKAKLAHRGGPALTEADSHRLDTLDTQLKAAGSHLTVYFRQLGKAFQGPTVADQTVQQRLAVVKSAKGLQRTLHDLHREGQDVVVLETLVTPDRYAVIVTTAESQKVEQFPIKAEDLNRKVAALQAALRDPHADPRGPAQDLYKIVVAPIEKDLAQAGAKTLMWSLDGTLRYVPIAALYDGHQYLVERFNNEVFTLGSQSGFGERAKNAWTGLGLGVSLPPPGSGFDPLPAVPDELRGIIHDAATTGGGGVLPGTVLLNTQFTDKAMTDDLRDPTYNLVHIASHFALKPGDVDNSFLLLGDGAHLSLKQIADDSTLFQDVDLLTLSACETATGGVGRDGSEVDGLGTFAQQDGAKSVIASLWPVSDASTRELMQTFYRWHETHAGVSKAEALRQAQLSLLHGGSASPAGDVSHRGVDAVPSRAEGATLPAFTPDPDAPYAHPFYWAPFILIGNWR